MLRTFIEFCQSVLCRDRIRVPPSEGRLLRLSPPCVLTIGSETVLIVSRTVSETTDGPSVRYECETDYGSAELIVRLNAMKTQVEWKNQEGTTTPLAEADLVVFGSVPLHRYPVGDAGEVGGG